MVYQRVGHTAGVKSQKAREGLRALCAILLVAVVGTACAAESLAQHPVDVQKLSLSGEHFKAITTYLQIPMRRLTDDARIAAAKSSWALGLHQQSADQLDSLLREKTISEEERVRLTFLRGVIDYQEERYQESALFAEKAISMMPSASSLRARAFLLWGQSSMRLKAYGAAESKFKIALSEAEPSDQAEVHFALGDVEMRLGKFADAEEHFKAIPMDHDRTPMAVRNLAALALETGQNDRAKFWLQKGKAEFPEAFLDSWADYGILKVALSEGDMLSARQVVDGAAKQYAPSDPWLILMQATLEESEWDRRAQLGRR